MGQNNCRISGVFEPDSETVIALGFAIHQRGNLGVEHIRLEQAGRIRDATAGIARLGLRRCRRGLLRGCDLLSTGFVRKPTLMAPARSCPTM